MPSDSRACSTGCAAEGAVHQTTTPPTSRAPPATKSTVDAVAWAARKAREGAGEILLASMDRDGTKSGYDLALLRAVTDAVSVPVGRAVEGRYHLRHRKRFA